jgi:hypothetical protein
MPAKPPSPEALGLQLALAAVQDNQTELAKICGCTQGAVWQMINKRNPRLSVQYVLKVEAAMHIPRHILRPDIYPPPPVGTPAAFAQAGA